jgi:glycosyltransferase involved in cell wall biosynthesis
MGRVRQLGRTVLSFLPKAGFVPPPAKHRVQGVSAMMTVKDEEDWIEKSVLSIADAVDEIVAVDNGSEDGTYGILTGLRERLGEKVRVLSFPREDFCAAVNYTLAQTTHRWILRWHGDFVAHTSGEHSIRGLIKRALALDAKRYYCIWIGPVSLDGDLFHQLLQTEVELEPFYFVYSPAIQYQQIGRFEVLQVPWYYKRLEWRELYFFHMRSVKPARRLLYRYFWTEWMSVLDKTHFPTLDSYVRHRVKEVFGTADLREAMKRRIQVLGNELAPYDKALYGEYPSIIREDLERPKYRLVYDGGRVVSRSDLESQRSS